MDGTTSVNGSVDSHVRSSTNSKGYGTTRSPSLVLNIKHLNVTHFKKKSLTGRTANKDRMPSTLLSLFARETKVLPSNDILPRINSSLGLFNKITSADINPFAGRSVKVLQQN